MPFFSIVMPAYNAETYIEEAINSVLIQNFRDWELVITNDGSYDHTLEIINKYIKDPRIRVLTINNSGSAKIARDYAITNAIGEYVIFLDSDDYLSPNYLEVINKSIIEKEAQIVLAQMCFFEDDGTVFRKLPSEELIGCSLSGYNALKLTLPSWKVGFNGAAIERKILNRLNLEDDIKHLINSDELDSRIYLTQANTVCVSHASYYFRNNLLSTTRRFNLRNYERLITDKYLIQFIQEKYPNDKELISTAIIHSVGTIRWLSSFYLKNRKIIGKLEKRECKQLLKNQIQFIKKSENRISCKDYLVIIISKFMLWIF